jgi:uncharacterized membrane protein YhfC
MDVLIRLLSASLMVLMPLGLGFALARRLGLRWRLFAIGAVTFVGSQVLHIPFNAWVLGPLFQRLGLSEATQGLPLAIVAGALGLSAGIFEEGARTIVYRFWLKGSRSWSQALMFGAGHGGIEAILLGGLALMALFQLISLRGVDLATVLPADQLELARAQVEAYWSAPWYEALLPAVERASALCLQVSLAVLVLQAFTRHNPLWVVLAIAWHALIDAVAVIAMAVWGVYVSEGLVALGALASLGILWRLWRPEAAGPVEPIPDALPPVVGFTQIGDLPPSTPEKLDNSRYTD